MLDSFEPLWRYFSNNNNNKDRPLPVIEITPSRKLSLTSQLRFARTCSEDSLDHLEKTCRKELRRLKLVMETTQECPSPGLLPSPSMCPHLANIGRSRTEPGDIECPPSTLPVFKRSVGDLNKEVALTAASKRSLAEVIGISPYQQKLVLQSWPNIYSTGVGGQFASNIFHILGNKNAKAKQMFSKANSVAVFTNSELDCTAMHSRATLELLDTIVKNLDQEHYKMSVYLVEMGKCHRSLRQEGLGTGVWDDFGDALLESVRKFDAVRKHKELRRAWLSLIAYVIDNLKQGHSLRTSSSYDLSGECSPSPSSQTGKKSFCGVNKEGTPC